MMKVKPEYRDILQWIVEKYGNEEFTLRELPKEMRIKGMMIHFRMVGVAEKVTMRYVPGIRYCATVWKIRNHWVAKIRNEGKHAHKRKLPMTKSLTVPLCDQVHDGQKYSIYNNIQMKYKGGKNIYFTSEIRSGNTYFISITLTIPEVMARRVCISRA